MKKKRKKKIKSTITKPEDAIENTKKVFWERKVIERNGFFPLFQKVIKSVEYPTVVRNITTNNGLFRFLFRWQDENICGVEVYRKIIIE